MEKQFDQKNKSSNFGSSYKEKERNVLNNLNRKLIPSFPLKNTDQKFLRITTYNILADSLIPCSTNVQEEYCSKYPYLDWKVRRNEIIKEIKMLCSDIICIQEFEKDQEFIEELKKIDYDIIFLPRPGEHSEGCAILFNSKFEFVDTYSLIFNMNIYNQDGKDLSSIYDRDNCAIMCTLKYNESYLVVTCTHLLFNKNRGDIKLAQIHQLSNAIYVIKNHVSSTYKVEFNKISSFICVDMNSLPCSAPYKYLTESNLNCDFLLPEKMTGQNITVEKADNKSFYVKKLLMFKKNIKYNPQPPKDYKDTMFSKHAINSQWYNDILKVEPVLNENSLDLKYVNDYKYKENNLILNSKIKFKSAYSEVFRFLIEVNFYGKKHSEFFTIPDKPTDKIDCFSVRINNENFSNYYSTTLEPPTTTVSNSGYNTVDFIFYDGPCEVVRVFDLPDFDRLFNEINFLPNDGFPSDHFSLTADFYLNN